MGRWCIVTVTLQVNIDGAATDLCIRIYLYAAARSDVKTYVRPSMWLPLLTPGNPGTVRRGTGGSCSVGSASMRCGSILWMVYLTYVRLRMPGRSFGGLWSDDRSAASIERQTEPGIRRVFDTRVLGGGGSGSESGEVEQGHRGWEPNQLSGGRYHPPRSDDACRASRFISSSLGDEGLGIWDLHFFVIRPTDCGWIHLSSRPAPCLPATTSRLAAARWGTF